MSDTLLPCPFCGATADIFPGNERRNEMPVGDYLQCSGCNVSMYRSRGENQHKPDVANLTERWNRRTAQARLVEANNLLEEVYNEHMHFGWGYEDLHDRIMDFLGKT
jgi:Lar family restriction alleviation protein